MVRLSRFLVAILVALTVLADPGSHSEAIAASYGDTSLTDRQPQISVLARRCPNLGNVQSPRGAGSCGIDLILFGVLSGERDCLSDLLAKYAASADRPPSAWTVACPHGPPKTISWTA